MYSFYQNLQILKRPLPMQETQIIKLTSLKSSITSLFENLSSKFRSSKDYDVTVIVKQSQQSTQPSIKQINKQESKKNAVGFNEKLLVLNEDLSESYISLDENLENSHQYKTDHHIGALKEAKIGKYKFNKKETNSNTVQIAGLKVSTSVQTEQQHPFNQSKQLLTELKIEDSPANSQRYSFKINDVQVVTEKSQSEKSKANGTDGGFLIEKYLNDAIQLIETNQIIPLQDFLYKFKEKYSFSNVRAQIKWSLLMAYCKQSKKQYERAAINYSQTIKLIKQNPLLTTIQIGDLYNHLARCYYEIREWNKAIGSYTEALNIFKKNKKPNDYACCITNLGVLYLEIGYFVEAQRCFLMTFNIKKINLERKSKASLINTYFLLFECNIKLRNFIQCERILGNINAIIETKDKNIKPIHKIRFNIKCGRLFFFEGKIDLAQTCYQTALKIIRHQNLAVIEHAQVFESMGLLKQQLGQLDSSKNLYEHCLKHLQKYVPFDNAKLQTIKKKLVIITDMIISKKSVGKLRTGKSPQKCKSSIDCSQEENMLILSRLNNEKKNK